MPQSSPMEYRPLHREIDEIRVISIEPSSSYSGERDENLWSSSLSSQGKESKCISSVGIHLTGDLICCTLDYVSLKDTIDR